MRPARRLPAVRDHGQPVGEQGPAIRRWAKRENVELCLTPANASWANPIEAQFGKSRAAAAVARCYQDLGLLPLGHMAEVIAADLADTRPWEAAKLLDEATRHVPGGS